MLRPLLHLVTNEPELLADHAEAYAALVAEELGEASASWQRRAVLGAVGLCFLGVGVVLAGVAVMLWALVPVDMNAGWALIGVPLVAFAIATGCLVTARRRDASPAFANVKRQVKADLALLREASANERRVA